MYTQQLPDEVPGGICAPKGFTAAGVHCGFRKNSAKKDLALIVSEASASAAALYTQNKVQGAPLAVTQRHLANGTAQAIVCNSGNANTCNANGIEIAESTCALVEEATGVAAADVVVASTGVIGQPMTMEPFVAGVPMAAAQLDEEGGTAAAEAIMTTDTHAKEIAVEFRVGEALCRMGAVGKGSGMINPNMATMLVFITTDVAISPDLLGRALKDVADDTLNQIYIDGDTSTNDMCVLLANGMAQNPTIQQVGAHYDAFCLALRTICVWMSREIARDGEGATKLIECRVDGAPTKEAARLIAKTVVGSDLLKAAMFGEDANWGRVLCAIGYTPAEFDISKVAVVLKSDVGSVQVCKNAAYHPYSEEEAARILAADRIIIWVDIGDGDQSASACGCDLTYDYVKINGDYRT